MADHGKRNMQRFTPDSPTVELVVPSPNHDAREGCLRPDILLLHYTGMQSTDAALERLCDAQAKVSSHYLVREDGSVIQLVAESRRARHAGVSSWESSSDINSRSVGIEIANPGHDFGYPEFADRQISAVISLCRDIVARLAVRPDRVLAHSDVAPSRKQDPGEKFPWRLLSAEGVGLTIETVPPVQAGVLATWDRGTAVSSLQEALKSYGYGLLITGELDVATREVVTAFQRHYRPHRVDGIADGSTIQVLQSLLAAKKSLQDKPTTGG